MNPSRFVPESILDTTLVGAKRYRLRQLLASGGLAHVYLAETEDEELVALKLLRPELEMKREILARFEREALAASRIVHENVVRVFEPARRSGMFTFFSAEHLVGVDLADLLASQKRLHPSRAVKIAVQVASGLQAAHGVGVIHRDVKPENIFLVHLPDGREKVKVIDFGSAALENDPSPAYDNRITMTTGFVGTPGYVAPEQAEGATGHPTADVYGLGVVLYESLEGRPPFTAPSWVDLLILHARSPVPPLSAPISTELSSVVLRCLAKKPDERFADMGAVLEALRSAPECRA